MENLGGFLIQMGTSLSYGSLLIPHFYNEAFISTFNHTTFKINIMSEDNTDLGEQADDAFENAKEKANEFADDAKDAANEFADEAKKTANEFADSAKEAMDELGGENKKLIAGILAIVLGGFGVHKFILGYQKEGIIMLVATMAIAVITCGIGTSALWIVGLIEGIIYLTKSDKEFYDTYQAGRKPWF